MFCSLRENITSRSLLEDDKESVEIAKRIQEKNAQFAMLDSTNIANALTNFPRSNKREVWHVNLITCILFHDTQLGPKIFSVFP